MTGPREELEQLLSEPVASARVRAATAFDEIAGDRPIVLFGAGGLGKRTARGLAALGRPAIAFADNAEKLAGTQVEGIPVYSSVDAVARFGKDAVFVVAVWRSPATERMSERIGRLRSLGAQRVTSFATLGWSYPDRFLPYYAIDLPHRVLEARDDVVRAFDLLADERSRREYVAHLRLRLLLDFDRLSEPETEPEYFAPDLYPLSDDERFVDCGAFDGDTVRSFLKLLPRFAGRVHAFEPDPDSFRRLERWRDGLPAPLRERIDVSRAGVGAKSGRVSFNEGGGTGSSIGAGGGEIEIVPLDEAVASMRPTLIKVDTEGYEPEVLDGARRTISTLAPKLALCVYHRQDHPWRIPLMTHALHGSYRFTLRSYCLDGWDLVLYAVPEKS
ncbi:MAG: FkbM family methyltransferase [Myxococcales bacterium]|nr:FkbM family methyltransferase [Myxococcales bacterium]